MANLIKRIAPLADRVLIRRVLPQTKTASGILLPESKLVKSNEGEVLAVGPGYTNSDGKTLPMPVAVGDKVLLPDYGGIKVSQDDEETFLFRADEILARIKKE